MKGLKSNSGNPALSDDQDSGSMNICGPRASFELAKRSHRSIFDAFPVAFPSTGFLHLFPAAKSAKITNPHLETI